MVCMCIHTMAKTRYNFMLSNAARKRLVDLNTNAEKIYGPKKGKGAYYSKIIEELLMNQGDPIEKLKSRKRELAKEMNSIDDEIKSIEETREEEQNAAK